MSLDGWSTMTVKWPCLKILQRAWHIYIYIKEFESQRVVLLACVLKCFSTLYLRIINFENMFECRLKKIRFDFLCFFIWCLRFLYLMFEISLFDLWNLKVQGKFKKYSLKFMQIWNQFVEQRLVTFWWPVRCSNHWTTWTEMVEQRLHMWTTCNLLMTSEML